MFESKKSSLLGTASVKSDKNSFLNAGMRKSAKVRSGNDAMKFNSTGNEFVDQFGQVGRYKEPRKYLEIEKDMAILWGLNPLVTIMFTIYIRMITRIVSLFDNLKTKEVQKGAGLKHEGILRMLWIAINHEDSFWKNIHIFISVGSWKDIIVMLQYDLIFHGWNGKVLNWDKFGRLILVGLENPNTNNLIKKYLPQIKAHSKCTTVESQADNMIAKYICSLLFGGKTPDEKHYNYVKYRKLKVSGTAHSWQQLISQGRMLEIDFNTIHGRALSQLVSSKFLANNGLEAKYETWISTKPVAKFTGYVYELASKIVGNIKKYQIDTINAQYKQLLEKAGKVNANFIVVKDTSGSMNSIAIGTNMSSYHIAKSLSIFFGNLIQGWFHNHYIDFSTTAYLRKIQGVNFYDHWITENRVESANTNFEAVANLFVQVYESGVPESEFPTGIILISDGEFDRTKMYDTTNIKAFKHRLLFAGLSPKFVEDFKFVFWDIRNEFYGRNQKVKFETYGPAKNVFYFSGFDGSVITFLLGTEGKSAKIPSTADELFNAALDQEIIQMITI